MINILMSLFYFSLGVASEPTGITSWDWQLSDFDRSTEVDLLGTDPDLVTASDIAAMKSRGTYTVCYVSVGTHEDWRSDADVFPDAVLGAPYVEWEGETFLDIRRLDVLLPIMQRRFQNCADLGFDAIEPDNMDMYFAETGFDLTREDALVYISALADMAHEMGLGMGQKNAPEMTTDLVGKLDFLLLEECAELGFCADAAPYVAAGKPALNTEYAIAPEDRAEVCALSARIGILTIFKNYNLGTSGSACF